jgi:hypothetical protein
MDIKRKSAKAVYDKRFDRFGVYVWQMPDGSIVTNEGLDPLRVNAEYGDIKRMKEIADYVRHHFGITEGKAKFLPGRRAISDEEYEIQMERMKLGLIPDDHDISAYVEEGEQKSGKRF